MPSDFGISALVAEAYDDFVEGLSILSDGAARDARTRAARRDPARADIRQINIPGWDDVFHVVPRPRATEREREAHYAAKREKRDSPLHPDLAFELERNARKARAIKESASPAYAQAFGQVLLGLDNVQDLLTSVATVGRLTINPAIRVAEAAGASRFATLAAAGRVTAKGLGRMVPGLGWVLIGADLLKLATQVGMLAFPAYALACQGPRAALAAGIPAFLMGPTLCKPIGAFAKINPFGRRAKLHRSRMIRNWRPSVSNLIELAQTTDTLFGVGLSLGGIVGSVQDAAFGAEQKLRGRDVRVNTDQITDSAHRILSGQLRRESTAKLHDLRTAATVLAYGPSLHGTQETFTVEEHIDALVATSAAFSIIEPYLLDDTVEALVELGLDAELQPPTYGEEHTRRSLEAEGEPWSMQRRWPLPGAPEVIRGSALLQVGAATIPAALAELLRPRRDQVESTFIGALVNRLTEQSAVVLTGTDDAISYQDLPLYQIMTALALSNRWVNVADGEGPLTAFVTAAELEMTRQGRNSLVGAELDRLARSTGVQLVRGLPPEAALPELFATRN